MVAALAEAAAATAMADEKRMMDSKILKWRLSTLEEDFFNIEKR